MSRNQLVCNYTVKQDSMTSGPIFFLSCQTRWTMSSHFQTLLALFLLVSSRQQQSFSMQTRASNATGGAAAASYSSPPPVSQPRAAETPSSAGSVASIASPNGKDPLPVHVQKQLCEDIEAHGGIATLADKTNTLHNLLNHLCESDGLRRSLYKATGDPVRRQLQNKVYSWQRYLNENTYEKKVLLKFGVIAAANRPSVLPVPTAARRKRAAVRELQEEDQDEEECDPAHVLSSPIPERVEVQSPQVPRSLAFDSAGRRPPTRPPTRPQTNEDELVRAFANMSVNNMLFFETGFNTMHPEVDNRTGTSIHLCRLPVLHTLCKFSSLRLLCLSL
jgi:hypothetical protein